MDIKKVLAYSTISQLGYMFLGLGVGAPGAAVFHLVTHAFFKALLFLGAGGVIHGMSGEQDMTRMGGLRARMPVTFATIALVALAALAVVGGFLPVPELVAPHAPVEHAPLAFMLLATGLALGGLGASYVLYVLRPDLPGAVAQSLGGVYRLVRDKFRVDELYG